MPTIFSRLLVLIAIVTCAFGAPITGAIGATGSTIIAPVSGGDLSILFTANPIATTTLSTMTAAGGSGLIDVVPLGLTSGAPVLFNWAGGLSFAATAPTPIVIASGPDTFTVTIQGTYFSSIPGYDATPGRLTVTFQEPSVAGLYPFSMSGDTVPEPTSFALAIAGIGLLLFRVRNRTLQLIGIATFLAIGLIAQPVATLPQHVVDITNGNLYAKNDPEFKPKTRFRCLRPVDQQSCTTLAPQTADGKDAYPIIRALLTKVVRDSGVGEFKISIVYNETIGFDAGWLFEVQTPRGQARLNAIWPALWLSTKGENDDTVRRRIAEVLKDVL